MTPYDLVAVLLAGLAAGTINTVVGSGTLITFPTLLAIGVPPVTANVSNNIGLVPGSIAGAVGYRRELVGQRRRVLMLLPASLAGGLVGSIMLLVLPEGAFEAIVPILILLGVLLVVIQPRVAAALRNRAAARTGSSGPRQDSARWVPPAVALTGVYGGYFGAAQGVLLMGVMGIGIEDDLQRLNAVKNVLAAGVNGIASVVFIVVADVDWRVVGLIALGSSVGGLLGASVGRSLPPLALRVVIVVVGLVAVTVFISG